MSSESSSDAARHRLEELSREILSTSFFFEAFAKVDLEGLVPFSKILFFNEGETIIQQGDSEDHHVYFSLMGKVSVYVDNQYILSLDHTWDIFGEMSICSSAPRSASVIR